MPTASEKREAEMEALHKKGKTTRLQVVPGGADLIEYINGTPVHLRAGDVFEHQNTPHCVSQESAHCSQRIHGGATRWLPGGSAAKRR